MAVPTPFLVGAVNCYLIEDDPLTLVDTGPNSGKSPGRARAGARAHGHAIEDLELIVITHQHMDHLGLLEILARRSGAEVAALDLLAPLPGGLRRQRAADDAYAKAMMRRHGVPGDLVTALATVGAAFRPSARARDVTRPLRDGTSWPCATAASGPAPARPQPVRHAVLGRASSGILIGGDHLLAPISSNPLISRPLDVSPSGAGERPRALIDYIASMRAHPRAGAELVLPGHGDRSPTTPR